MTFCARLDAVIDQAVADNRIVGTVTMLARAGETIYCRAAGLADREAGLPVEVDTVFRHASLTKPIVAATILAMRDAGLLGLGDAVTDYLPWFTPALPDGRVPVITLHHLLTHTSGLAYDLDPTPDEIAADPELAAANGDYHILSLEKSMRRLANRPLTFAPGTDWLYSLSLDVLGLVAANLAGGTLADAVGKYVTGPLGMPDTRFHLDSTKRLAVAYADGTPLPTRMTDPQVLENPSGGTNTFSPGRILDPRAYESGGSGMAGTAADFLKFLVTLERGGAPILSPNAMALATRNRIGEVTRDVAGEKFGYFGAIAEDPAASGAHYNAGSYHWGGVFGSRWFIDPEAELAVVSLTNTAFEGCNGKFSVDIRNACYD